MTPFTSLIQWGHFRPANLEISKSYLKKLFCNFKIFSRTIRQKRPIWPEFDISKVPSDSDDQLPIGVGKYSLWIYHMTLNYHVTQPKHN